MKYIMFGISLISQGIDYYEVIKLIVESLFPIMLICVIYYFWRKPKKIPEGYKIISHLITKLEVHLDVRDKKSFIMIKKFKSVRDELFFVSDWNECGEEVNKIEAEISLNIDKLSTIINERDAGFILSENEKILTYLNHLHKLLNAREELCRR